MVKAMRGRVNDLRDMGVFASALVRARRTKTTQLARMFDLRFIWKPDTSKKRQAQQNRHGGSRGGRSAELGQAACPHSPLAVQTNRRQSGEHGPAVQQPTHRGSAQTDAGKRPRGAVLPRRARAGVVPLIQARWGPPARSAALALARTRTRTQHNRSRGERRPARTRDTAATRTQTSCPATSCPASLPRAPARPTRSDRGRPGAWLQRRPQKGTGRGVARKRLLAGLAVVWRRT